MSSSRKKSSDRLPRRNFRQESANMPNFRNKSKKLCRNFGIIGPFRRLFRDEKELIYCIPKNISLCIPKNLSWCVFFAKNRRFYSVRYHMISMAFHRGIIQMLPGVLPSVSKTCQVYSTGSGRPQQALLRAGRRQGPRRQRQQGREAGGPDLEDQSFPWI